MGGERAKQRCERVEGDVMVAKRKTLDSPVVDPQRCARSRLGRAMRNSDV